MNRTERWLLALVILGLVLSLVNVYAIYAGWYCDCRQAITP